MENKKLKNSSANSAMLPTSTTPKTLTIRTPDGSKKRIDLRDRSGRTRQKFMPLQQNWGSQCNYCGKQYLTSVTERNSCCAKGAYYCYKNNPFYHTVSKQFFSILEPLPRVLRDYALTNTAHMSKVSAYYNSILSIASIGTANGQDQGGYEQIAGASSVKLNGRTVHFLRQTANTFGGINYFTFDATEEMKSHVELLNKTGPIGKHGPIVPEILEAIFNEQKRINKYVHDLRLAGSITDTLLSLNPSASDYLKTSRSLIASTNVQMNELDISGFSADNCNSNICFYYKLKGEPNTQKVDPTDGRIEPLCFPLFFCYGEEGYDLCKQNQTDESDTKFLPYMRARILIPEPGLILPNKNGKLINVNRFQIFSRAMQYYIVERLSNAIDYRLKWHKGSQSLIFGQLNTERVPGEQTNQTESSTQIDQDRETFDSSNRTFLSDSFTGCPRHLRALAKNALVAVTQLGVPTVFITATFSQLWPELNDQLLSGQTIFDRPDIASQVFHQRLQALLHNLRQGKYFGGAKVVYLFRVIEYQHRGLPHCHIVCRLSTHPDGSEQTKLTWISEHIHAKFPSNNDQDYSELITKYMIHKCSSAINGCRDKHGHCKRGYEDFQTNEADSFDGKGFPIYHRPTQEDLKVVAHNKDILTDWQGHINVEFCGKVYTVLYLYNYLFKGNAKVHVKLDTLKNVDPRDEIEIFIRGRMLSSQEAMWRIMGYQTYPASEPTVTLIKVKLPSEIAFLEKHGKSCDLACYFARPNNVRFSATTYAQFFAEWLTSVKLPKTYQKIGNAQQADVFELPLRCGRYEKIYLFRRQKEEKHLVRLGMVPVKSGERWYLRLLLLHVPAFSFKQLRTVSTVVYPTFQEAALARGLLESHTEASLSFAESMNDSTPSELRLQFVLLTVQGFATVPIFGNEAMRFAMQEDFFMNNNNRKRSEHKLLTELQILFKRCGNKTLATFGFPEPKSTSTELSREEDKYDPVEQDQLYNVLKQSKPLTQEMETLFNAIGAALHSNDSATSHIFLLQGEAGTGKSTFAKLLMAYARSHEILALGCASTALAASIYPDMSFDTAHGLFDIPVLEDENDFDKDGELMCNFHANKERLELLQKTKLFIWDEISSQHIRDFNAVYNAMDEFKGKILLLMGDVHQICPVVTHASNVHEAIAASIYMSRLVRDVFQLFRFTTNLRLQTATEDEIQYSHLLKDIGSGNHDQIRGHGIVDKSQCMAGIYLPGITTFFDPYLSRQCVYGDTFDIQLMQSRCILATTNVRVDYWNELTQQMNQNNGYQLISSDIIADVDDPYKIMQSMLTEEVLHHYNVPTAPPHILFLKVDDICLLLRHVDKLNGFTNNTRVKIVAISPFRIRVQSLTAPQLFRNIPRFRFNITPFKNITIQRTQFPIRLAYSMTFNRSQGQEFSKLLIDLSQPAFSHGHLYVALSRIRTVSSLALYTDPEFIDEYGTLTVNVVYPQLITSLNNY